MTTNTYIPFCKTEVDEDEIDAVAAVLRSGWLTTGKQAQSFEEEFCEYVGCSGALAVNSCTAALHLALVAHGVGPGDEVITTPLTFCSTVGAIEHVGAKPVLADVSRLTGNISPEEIERRLTPATRAILPVHFGGLACDMTGIEEIAERHGLVVIEDAAHAVGTFTDGEHVGSKNTGAFSFYVTKNLSTGEGGMLTSSDPEFIEYCRKLSLHGMSRDAWKRYNKEGSWFYSVEHLGYKYNLCDILAALGRKQLARLDAMNARRRQIAEKYTRAFAENDLLEFFQADLGAGSIHAHHLYPIVLNLDSVSIDRKTFIEKLEEANIGCSVHFIPIHYHPYFKNAHGWKPGDFPACEFLYERIVSLPIYSSLTDADVFRVIGAVQTVLSDHTIHV